MTAANEACFPINHHVTRGVWAPVACGGKWNAEDKKSFCVAGILHGRGGGNEYEGGVVLLGGLWMESMRSLDLSS